MRRYSKVDGWLICIGAILTLGGMILFVGEIIYCTWVGPLAFNHNHAFAFAVLFIAMICLGQMSLNVVKEDE
jgi:membrane protein implicated in regulation of membrane protease activity